jgi:homeobox protein Nkx-3.2
LYITKYLTSWFYLGTLNHDVSFKLTEKSTKRKRRKHRTAFTTDQIYALEKRFTHQKYLTSSDRDQIANELRLSAAQVITVNCLFFLKFSFEMFLFF